MLDTTLPARVMTAQEITKLCVERAGGQRALSRATGYSQVTISNWCKGEHTPNTIALRDICQAAGLEFVMGVVDK